MGEVLKYVIKATDEASPELEKIAKAADKADDAIAGAGDEAKKAAPKIEGLGNAAEAAGADMQTAAQKVAKFEQRAGATASIAGGLATGLDKISPAAGGAVRAVGDLATGFQAVGTAGAGLAGPLALITVALAAGAKVWSHFKQKQEDARASMEATRAAANALKVAMGQWDLSRAENQIANLAASGKITNREMAEYTAHTKAQEAASEVFDEAKARYDKATQDRLDAQIAKEAELRKGGHISSKVLRELEAKRTAAFNAQSKAASDLSKIQHQITKDAELMMDTYDKTQANIEADKAAQDKAAGSGGGAAKGPSDFEKLIQQADALSQIPTTRLEKLNAMLRTLQDTVAGDEAAAALLERRIVAVTKARDAEKAAADQKLADRQAASLGRAAAKTESLIGAIDGLTRAYEEPISEADLLRAKREKLQGQWAAIVAEAEKSGVAGTEAFAKMRSSMEANLGRVQAAIDSLEPPKKFQMQSIKIFAAIGNALKKYTGANVWGKDLGKLGQLMTSGVKQFAGWSTQWIPQSFKDAVTNEFKAMSQAIKGIGNVLTGGGGGVEGAIGVAASGGASAVSAAAGAMGGAGAAGAAGAAMQLGMGGAQQYEAAVQEEAAKKAAERQEKMAKEREQKLAQGFSEAELEAQGLGAEDVAKAGEVTDKDIKAAEGEVDRGEEMAKFVEGLVTGVVEGIRSIIVGLPEILEFLIPVLLTELPAAIIVSVFRMIPKLLKMLFYGLPKALAQGFVRGFQQIWKAITKFFADLFDFGFQTGGYIPKTGRYVLHQGERVVPASGASTGTAKSGLAAFAGPAGPQIHLNAAVVDPDTVPALGRILEKSLGAYGRTTSPFFGAKDPTTSI